MPRPDPGVALLLVGVLVALAVPAVPHPAGPPSEAPGWAPAALSRVRHDCAHDWQQSHSAPRDGHELLALDVGEKAVPGAPSGAFVLRLVYEGGWAGTVGPDPVTFQTTFQQSPSSAPGPRAATFSLQRPNGALSSSISQGVYEGPWSAAGGATPVFVGAPSKDMNAGAEDDTYRVIEVAFRHADFRLKNGDVLLDFSVVASVAGTKGDRLAGGFHAADGTYVPDCPLNGTPEEYYYGPTPTSPGATYTVRASPWVPPPPTAEFTFAPETATTLVGVRFTDASTKPEAGIRSWHWDFGDGTNSTERNPVHRFTKKGSLPVTLRVIDGDGLVATRTKTVPVVNLPPEVSFRLEPAAPKPGEDVRFEAVAADPDGSIASWTWRFAGGREAGGPNATHRFATEGRHRVTLTVVDDDDASATFADLVTVANATAPAVPAENATVWVVF
ncbi:MAG: PKD domain-containing protein, partial [Methanobacteriota archaeon]